MDRKVFSKPLLSQDGLRQVEWVFLSDARISGGFNPKLLIGQGINRFGDCELYLIRELRKQGVRSFVEQEAHVVCAWILSIKQSKRDGVVLVAVFTQLPLCLGSDNL